MRRVIFAATLLCMQATGPSRADESALQLKQGDGLEAVQDHCAACHSLDYIQMNSPIQDEKGWTATVAKMVKVMGAPIPEGDQKAIITYLSSHYAKQ